MQGSTQHVGVHYSNLTVFKVLVVHTFNSEKSQKLSPHAVAQTAVVYTLHLLE